MGINAKMLIYAYQRYKQIKFRSVKQTRNDNSAIYFSRTSL